jgi:hypothetical protein
MRVLLLVDGDENDSVAGRAMRALAGCLVAAGCQVRCLPGAADISQTNVGDFTRLSDAAIAAYRASLRCSLDRTIDEFAPEVIHAAHVWLPAHLALESGVPYVLSTWGAELPVYRADARFRPFIEQAAENASRIVADCEATRERLLAALDLDAAIVTLPDPAEPAAAWFIDLYQQAVAGRRLP